jgi:hypothetical protein
MLLSAFHLVIRSWCAMVAATGNNTLGFLLWTFGLAVAAACGTLTLSWLRSSKNAGYKTRFNEATQQAAIPAAVEFLFMVAAVLIVLVIFIVRTIAFDHSGLRYERQENAAKIASLERDLAYRKNNISTTDAVFPNLIYMMQAFRSYKNAIGKESCVIRYTSPRETEPLASVFAQLSIQADNCPTFGPGLGDFDPDEVSDTNNGMVPEAIVFHAPKDDKAADILFMNLSNQIRMVRSYDPGRANYQIPKGGYKHTVRLQFGSNVKWNSELR